MFLKAADFVIPTLSEAEGEGFAYCGEQQVLRFAQDDSLFNDDNLKVHARVRDLSRSSWVPSLASRILPPAWSPISRLAAPPALSRFWDRLR